MFLGDRWDEKTGPLAGYLSGPIDNKLWRIGSPSMGQEVHAASRTTRNPPRHDPRPRARRQRPSLAPLRKAFCPRCGPGHRSAGGGHWSVARSFCGWQTTPTARRTTKTSIDGAFAFDALAAAQFVVQLPDSVPCWPLATAATDGQHVVNLGDLVVPGRADGTVEVETDRVDLMPNLRGFRNWSFGHTFAFGDYVVEAHTETGLRYRTTFTVRDDLGDPARVDVPCVLR